MQLCKMLLQESSGTKHQSSAIGKNQLDTRERTMKKMWQLFHYLFSPTCVSRYRISRYRRLKNCDKSLGITLPSLNFLRRQIIKHLHKSLSAIFVSEVQTNCNFLGQCYSAKFTAVRRARRVRLTFFWEFDCSEQLPNILQDNIELGGWSLPSSGRSTTWTPKLSGWSPRSLRPRCRASWRAGQRQWLGWACPRSSAPSVVPRLLHCPPIASSQPSSFIRIKELWTLKN